MRVATLDDSDASEYLIALRAFGKQSNVAAATADAIVLKVWHCRLALTSYWREHIWENMSADVSLFKGFSVLDPIQAVAMGKNEIVQRLGLLIQKEEIVGQGTNAYRRVGGVKYFNDQVMHGLFGQLEEYLRVATLFVPTLSGISSSEQPSKLWTWWWAMKDEKSLSYWAELAQVAVLHQPSSAVIERFFSVFKGRTSRQQVREDEETSLIRAQLGYNKGKVGI